MRRRKPSPQETKLVIEINKEMLAFEAWYRRLQRAARAMDKARRRLAARQRKLRNLQTEPQAPA